MDLSQKNLNKANGAPAQVNPSPTSNPNDELSHITQEMYKKNMELNERNKTLALLRKIDEIVLSTVTDLRQIAQQVADLLVEEEFRLVSVHVLKGTLLIPLAISASPSDLITKYGRDRFLTPPTSLVEKENFLVKAAEERRVLVSQNLHDVLSKGINAQEARDIQEEVGIKSIIVYPLIVREETIGVLVIGIREAETETTLDQKAFVDRMGGVVGIALDNSLLYQSIQDANERLKQLDKLKDEFVSLASHELRTPMTIIKSYLWLFMDKKKGQLSDKERGYLERAYESTQRLINLVNDMLNVSRIESGRLTLAMKDIQIAELIDKVVSELVPRAAQLGLKLSFTKPGIIVVPVKADPERIEQVLINLIGNSLKFTPPGGSILVSLAPREKDILIKVADNGRGMTPEVKAKLFQKFATTGSSYLHKQDAQGTGLGLYLSKSLIEMHGGKMWAESEGENKGSRFSFTLPYSTVT